MHWETRYQCRRLSRVKLHLTLQTVSTSECVGELLAVRLEVQMPLATMLFHNHLTLTMSMESVSLMEHLVTTSGPMLLVYQKHPMRQPNTSIGTIHPIKLFLTIRTECELV